MKNRDRLLYLQEMKRHGKKITCLTAYDAGFSRILEDAGVDVVLVGDSLGMVLHGAKDTLKVSMEDMIYHTRIVSRGLDHTLLVADMPYMSYTTPDTAVKNAGRLLEEGGADVVKLEGGSEIMDVVQTLCDQQIAVCAHLGLQPQSVQKYGGFKVQGRSREEADRIGADALALQAAGVQMLVLECVPRELARRITASLSIPVIGIGAGADCDGQVLVLYDILGVSTYIPKMANDFLSGSGSIRNAVRDYIDAVRSGAFPGPDQGFD